MARNELETALKMGFSECPHPHLTDDRGIFKGTGAKYEERKKKQNH